MPDKWATIDLPVLKAIDRLAEHRPQVNTRDISGEINESAIAVQHSVRRLYDAGYIDGFDATTQTEYFDLMNLRLLERGLQAVEAWPSDTYDGLLVQIRDELDRETDGARRGRLKALLDGLAGAGREIAVEFLAEWAKRSAGL
jgi:hypothetical protein